MLLQREQRVYTSAMRFGNGTMKALSSPGTSSPSMQKSQPVRPSPFKSGSRLASTNNEQLTEFQKVEGWTPQVIYQPLDVRRTHITWWTWIILGIFCYSRSRWYCDLQWKAWRSLLPSLRKLIASVTQNVSVKKSSDMLMLMKSFSVKQIRQVSMKRGQIGAVRSLLGWAAIEQ